MGRRQENIKNRHDRRYTAVQSRIERVLGRLLKRGKITGINVKVVSKESEIWCSTFYDHFKHLDEAVVQFNHKMRPELKKLLSEAKSLNCSPEVTFAKILHFIYVNREYYDVMVCCKNPVALLEIAEIFKKLICRDWSNYGEENTKRCFYVFAWEMSGVICYWGRVEKFDEQKIMGYAKYLAGLAKNVPRRLSVVDGGVRK